VYEAGRGVYEGQALPTTVTLTFIAPSIMVPLFITSRGRSLDMQGPVSKRPINWSNIW